MKKGDTVYFKSPFGKEKGIVIDGPGPDGNITVETEDGTLFVFPKRKVMSMNADKPFEANGMKEGD